MTTTTISGISFDTSLSDGILNFGLECAEKFGFLHAAAIVESGNANLQEE
jgi:hypothetical protein